MTSYPVARHPLSRRLRVFTVLLSVVVLSLSTAGCDSSSTGEGETVILQPQEVTFRFQFEGGQADGAGSLTVSSEGATSLEDLLPVAYAREDVQRVTITEVALERIQPLENLSDFLRRADFAIDGVGDSQVVASLGDPPPSRRSEMSLSTPGIGDLVTDQPFQGVLQAVLIEPDLTSYVLEVQMTIQIQVLDV